ncbi:MAG: CHAD domain-containing protein [Campylobacterota bacterium]|nr:CHAD domain-containing protein [Campylobacterota bacterium]
MKKYEIERKFLLKPCSPERFLQTMGLDYIRYDIHQYYLSSEEYGDIRYRRKDMKFYKTIKIGKGMVREEQQYLISEEEYIASLDKHSGKIIEKDRFVFTYDGRVYELDNFKKELEGLCYLEIEFDDEAVATAFVIPEIFSSLYLSEVTDDSRFNNSALSRSTPIPILDSDLEKLARKIKRTIPSDSDKDADHMLVEPFESTETAILVILRKQLNILRISQEKLFLDSDNPEALHALRVSMRRVRSTLGEFRHYFFSSWVALHRRNLSLLMAQTNKKRECDVLLENIDTYVEYLPEEIQRGLNPLLLYLLKKNQTLHEKLVRWFDNELLPYEIYALGRPNTDESIYHENLSQPITITSIQILQNRLDKIMIEGSKLDLTSNSDEYHQLRIQFKKLLYFIEEMKPIVDNSKYNQTVNSINNIQSVLGEYRDLVMSRLLIDSFSREYFTDNKIVKVSIDRLNSLLLEKEEEKKIYFKRLFLEFKKEEKSLKRLFEYY